MKKEHRKFWRAKGRKDYKKFVFSHEKEKQYKWRLKVLIQKYNGVCVSCGCQVNLIHDNPKQATIDHILPKSLGGKDNLENLQLLCKECNNGKGNDYE